MRKMVRHVYEIFEEFYQPSRLVDWWVPWSNPVLPPCTWEPAGPGVFEHRTLGEPAHCWLGTSRASSVGGWLAKDFLEKLMFSEMMLCPPPTPTDKQRRSGGALPSREWSVLCVPEAWALLTSGGSVISYCASPDFPVCKAMTHWRHLNSIAWGRKELKVFVFVSGKGTVGCCSRSLGSQKRGARGRSAGTSACSWASVASLR